MVRGRNLEDTASLPADAGGSGQEMPLVLYALQGGQNRADKLHLQWAAEDVSFVSVPQIVPHTLSVHRFHSCKLLSSVIWKKSSCRSFSACCSCKAREHQVRPARDAVIEDTYFATPDIETVVSC